MQPSGFQKSVAAVSGVLFAASALIGATAGPAAADPYGSGSGTTGYLPDNAGHSWCTYGSFVDDWYNPIFDSMNKLDSQTDMSDTYVSLCTSSTDAVFFLSNSASMGSSTLGSTICAAVNSAGRCETAQVKLNTQLLTNYTQRRKTACHEVGRTAGLSHDGDYGGCMVSGYSSASSYSTHHVNHINAAF